MPPIRVTVTVESGEELLRLPEDQHPLVVNDGEEVSWIFVHPDGTPFPEPLEVAFHAFLPERSATNRSAVHPFGNPFSRGQLRGIVDGAAPAGLYVYSVFHQGDTSPIKWARPPLLIAAGFEGFFGGIQKPAGPPGGSATASG